VKKFLYQHFLKFCRVLVRLSWLYKPKHKDTLVGEYSICIVTYCRRFEKNFKPLIRQLSSLYPNSEIIVGVNGYYDQEVQSNYLEIFEQFISQYKNITWFSYDKGQSLSKMWNQCILRSSHKWTLVLNDDIILTKRFRKSVDNIILKNDTIHILNMSWSHFFISKSIISEIGWFDERLPGVGNEDWDYEIRAMLGGKKVEMIKTFAIFNLEVLTKDFSYSPVEKVINRKYSNSNWEFFNRKWSVVRDYEEGYITTRFPDLPYIRLNEGMETPLFY